MNEYNKLKIQKKEIIKIGECLYKRNLTIATSGNISIRADEGILITASGTRLGHLKEEDIVLIDLESGEEISEGHASSEKMLHIEIYKKRPEINAVIHTHPVYLTTFAACHKKLDAPIMSENILYFEDIPVAEYAMPSSKELVEKTMECLKTRDVVIMANHGAIAAADSLEHAFSKMETAEYYAQVTLNCQMLGGARLLSQKDINDLIKLRKN